MTETSIGAGIQASEVPSIQQQIRELSPLEQIKEELRAELRHEMDMAVADVERRYAQARELEMSALYGTERSVHAEDLNLNMAILEGYTLTSNSPANGSIAWASLHIVYQGVDYTIADGNTANRFVWFVKPGSGTTATLQTSNTQPTLGPNDTLVFVNNGGVAIEAGSSGIAWAVGTAVIGDAQVSGGISQSKVSGLGTTLSDLNDAVTLAQATADGAISQTFGPTFPWANGVAQDASKIGDVHTFQGAADQVAYPDGTSYKWSGSAGNPANQWVLITDANVSKALADAAAAKNAVAGKTTAYYRTVAQGAPPTPTEGFTAGDEWIQTDNGNYTQRWSGSAWVAAQVGNANIASGISGSKIGSGISPANLTGAGTAPTAAIPQLPAAKLNIASHLFY